MTYFYLVVCFGFFGCLFYLFVLVFLVVCFIYLFWFFIQCIQLIQRYYHISGYKPLVFGKQESWRGRVLYF